MYLCSPKLCHLHVHTHNERAWLLAALNAYCGLSLGNPKYAWCWELGPQKMCIGFVIFFSPVQGGLRAITKEHLDLTHSTKVLSQLTTQSNTQQDHLPCEIAHLFILQTSQQETDTSPNYKIGGYPTGQTGWITKHPQQTTIITVVKILMSSGKVKENLLETATMVSSDLKMKVRRRA